MRRLGVASEAAGLLLIGTVAYLAWWPLPLLLLGLLLVWLPNRPKAGE